MLRDWREDDIDPFIRSTNTPSVMRWLGGVKSDDEMRSMVRGRLMRWQEERGFTFWVVERRSDGDLLGFCGLKLSDDPEAPFRGEIEVGWRFREEDWGQGYAKEAASASLDFGFDRLKAPTIVAITFPGNEASWGLMRRLGMQRRPDLDYEDLRYPDLNPTIVYAISREAWHRWIS